MKFSIPSEVKEVLSLLEKHGFEAYIVGGCVRDILLKKEPQDWDVTTNAAPEEIQKVFKNSFYENKFFTVTVLTESENPKLKEIEVTTYRSEFKYQDRRHPEEVQYAKTVEEDLSRRDFTVNAIALRLASLAQGKLLPVEIVDPFKGQKDLKAKLIRAVREAEQRFEEDALRMMRAARFKTTLGFTIESATEKAIVKNSHLLNEIAKERIRDEFAKIIMAESAMQGIETLRELGLLQYIIPELEAGYGVSQNKHHKYAVWEHNLLSLEYAAKQKWSKVVRLASLFHDIGKPESKRGKGEDATFYGHETVGAKSAKRILSRLKFSKEDAERVSLLIRYHMFYYNVDEVTEYSVRKLVRNVGAENIEELLQLRQADRIGSGVPKAEPYKLRHLRYLMEKVAQDPISVKMLKISGTDLMRIGDINPGPIIGFILDVLLGEVLLNPKNNKKEYLEEKTKELVSLSVEELKTLSEKAKKERESVEIKRDEMTKQKYWVT